MRERVLLVGVDHRSVGLDWLERLLAAKRRGAGCVGSLCQGSVLLATCHRLELYVEQPRVPPRQLFAAWLGLADDDPALDVKRLRILGDAAAGRHLLRVAAGLESAVLGEDQIQGQVRGAYGEACRQRSPGPLLHRLFHAAFRAGKRVRSETALSCGGRSLAGVAVNEVERELGGLAGRTVLVLGAGEMARVASRRLLDRLVGRLLLANRTWDRTLQLARSIGGEPLPWSWRQSAVAESDAVICATGASSPVLSAALLLASPRTRVVIDLAVPRNVEPLPGSGAKPRIIDLEILSRHLAESERARHDAILQAEEVVEAELALWRSWVESRGSGAVTFASGRQVAG